MSPNNEDAFVTPPSFMGNRVSRHSSRGFGDAKSMPKSNVNKMIDVIGNTVSAASDIRDSLNKSGLDTDALQQAALDSVTRLVVNQVNKATERAGGTPSIRAGNGKGGGYGNDFSGDPSNNPNHGRALDVGSTPSEIVLDTGIEPNVYSSMYHDALDSFCSPLHLTFMRLVIPGPSANDVSTRFLYDSVLPSTISAIQAAISFSLPSTITSANIGTAYDDLVEALQLYYFYASIIQYDSDALNTNQGMKALRNAMSATDLNNLVLLREQLCRTPIPPNLKEICFYLMNNYQMSPIPGSAMIKFSPVPFATGSQTLDPSYLSSALSALTTSTNTTIWSVLATAAPNWISNDLFTPSTIPLHDSNFSTLFTNAPASGSSTVLSNPYNFIRPQVSSTVAAIPYFSHTNRLDGMIYALFRMYDSSTAASFPALFQIISTVSATNVMTNRLSYYNNNGTTQFWDLFSSTVADQLKYMRGETFKVTNIGGNVSPISILTSQPPGTQYLLGVNAMSAMQTTTQAFYYLLDPSSIRRKIDARFSNRKK